MDRAVSQLDAIIEQRTVHSTKSLLLGMQAIVGMAHLFDDLDEQQAFGQICRNFEIESERRKYTSWGRTQFRQWWGACLPQKGSFRAEYTAQPRPVRPAKPNYTFREDQPTPPTPGEGYTDLYSANLRISELEVQLREIRWKISRIQNVAADALKIGTPHE
jgi:hypothetical protein